jgi:hypothetical protein
MARSTNVASIWTTVIDSVGRVAKTAIQLGLSHWDPTTGQGAAWKAILVAIVGSSGTVKKQSSSRGALYATFAVPGPRCNREDKMTAALVDFNGVEHVFKIPTPSTALSAVLGGDALNLAGTPLNNWLTAMAAHACSSDGVGFTGQCTGGRYVRHKPEKKGGY